MPVRLNGSTSGYTEIASPAVGVNNTITLPTITNGSLVALDANGRLGIGTASPSGNLHSNAAYTNTSDMQVIADGNIAGFNARSSTGGRFSLATGYIGANITSLLTSTGTSNPSSEVMRFTHSTGEIDFFVGGSGAAKIDASRRLLVGTSSTSANTTGLFQGYGGVPTGPGHLRIATGTSSPANGANLGLVLFSDSEHTNCAFISADRDGGTWSASSKPTRLVFSTTADGSASPTERMRITSAGIINLNGQRTGVSAPMPGSGNTRIVAASAGGIALSTYDIQDYTAVQFVRDVSGSASQVGTITCGVSSTAYNTSSDYRLKENVEPITGAAARILQLKPSRFNFIVDPDNTVDGFIAHEAQAVVPECVTGTKDAEDDDGNPVYQGIDQSKLVPLLTAALQEAIAKIETLEARLTAAGIE
jgi:hypothetical protein